MDASPPTESTAPADAPSDERELSDVFLRMPAAAQTKMRSAWQKERDALQAWHDRQRRRRVVTVVECAVLLATCMLLVRGVRYGALALSLLVGGPLLGLLVDRVQPGRVGAAGIGLLGYSAIVVCTGWCSLDAVGWMFTGTAFGMYGVRREFRTSVGEA